MLYFGSSSTGGIVAFGRILALGVWDIHDCSNLFETVLTIAIMVAAELSRSILRLTLPGWS